MTIFKFDEIVKNKYKIIDKNIDKNIINISFEEYKKKYLEKIFLLSSLYFTGISENYIKILLENNKKSKILFLTIGQKFLLDDIISIIIYHKTSSNNKNKYYILCFGIHKKFRKFGYGKYTLDEFIEWIKLSNKSNKQNVILLKSIESSLNFYLTYGFVQTDLISNKLFFKYEPNEELKANQEKILEYIIN